MRICKNPTHQGISALLLVLLFSLKPVDSSSVSMILNNPVVYLITSQMARIFDVLFDLGLIFPNPLVSLSPWLTCSLRVLFLDFSLTNFARYDRYFRDNSEMTLAQSGIFKGAKNIEEYVKFASPEFNPYTEFVPLDPSIAIRKETYFVDFEDGQCIFHHMFMPRLFPVEGFGRSDIVLDVGVGVKVNFDFNRRYFSQAKLFFAKPALAYIFHEVLNTDGIRGYICSVLASSCEGIASSPADCKAQLAALPTTDDSYIDGDSSGCRALHAFLAEQDAELHCPHISLTPLEDPDGSIKCQNSTGIQASDLLTEDDLAAFASFFEKFGVDGTLGYRLVNEEE